ncbi:RidA family protein [Endozoicomonas ascidiicola]|uniref:RidA family protein n=1 Tax=Endozoicomonas ascidiicola TaxID=1698521 RepID=UPI00082ADB5F|nr:RidA family protein [Endozoicomonas ascidiicola]
MVIKRVPQGAVQHKTAGPYSPVLEVMPGTTVLLSGQAPLDMEGNTIGETIEEQTRITIEHCIRLLDNAGCTLENVIEVNVYLTDLSEWPRFNEVYKEYFKEPYPARTAVGVQLLNNFKVEITMRAMKPQV